MTDGFLLVFVILVDLFWIYKGLVLILERRSDGVSTCSNRNWPVDGSGRPRTIALSAGSWAAEDASVDAHLKTQFHFKICSFTHLFCSIIFFLPSLLNSYLFLIFPPWIIPIAAGLSWLLELCGKNFILPGRACVVMVMMMMVVVVSTTMIVIMMIGMIVTLKFSDPISALKPNTWISSACIF